ncbi:MAG: aminoacyl-tRNA hydrolase, partial [Candidatus Thiodiazotropha endolucinida]
KPKKRIPTKPTKASNRRRLDSKTRRGRQKALRRKVED